MSKMSKKATEKTSLDEPMTRVQTAALRYRGLVVVPHYDRPKWVLPGGQELSRLPGAEPEVLMLWPRSYDLTQLPLCEAT
jgi:hypothetical protein